MSDVAEIGSVDDIKIRIIEFNGKRYVDIRKFYEDEESQKPTKKGIAMKCETFESLMRLLNEKKEEIKRQLGEVE